MKKLIILILFCGFLITSCSKTNCGELKYTKGITKLNGELFNGTCESFYFTGEIKSKEEYLNGLDHGKWIFYYRNGEIQTEGVFSLGKKVGLWKYYFEKGIIWKEERFSTSGKPDGYWKEFDENGTLIKEKYFEFIDN